MAEVSVKKKRKSWVRIVGTKSFKNNELGESYTSDPRNLIGKRVDVSLASMIGDMRKQNVVIGFKITEVDGNQAKAEIVSYKLISAHVRRLVRPGKEKMDDSFVIETKDKEKIKVKPIILTRIKTKRSVLTAIRKRVREYMADVGKENSFSDIVKAVVSTELIRNIKNDIKKIYPLSVLEFRVIELVK